jgi:predicted LPLAT superfamily acyltransferase
MGENTDDTSHWTRVKEKSPGYWLLKVTLFIFKVFPAFVLSLIVFPAGFFTFLFAKGARKESRRYLQKVSQFVTDPKTAKKCVSFFAPLRHIVSFSLTISEKIQGWGGKFSFKDNIHFHDDDIADFVRTLDGGKGVFLFSAHLGNFEMMRGLKTTNSMLVSREVPFTAIMDMEISRNFIRMLNELNPQSSLDVISAKDITPETAIKITEKLAAGEIIASAGDRTSPNPDDTKFTLPFLGEDAFFSIGVYYLAVLMNYPVYFLFAIRRGDLSLKSHYDIFVHKSGLELDCPRKERQSRAIELAKSLATHMENYCKKYPFQWYNFFNFWQK